MDGRHTHFIPPPRTDLVPGYDDLVKRETKAK
jgi:hypothetical protein